MHRGACLSVREGHDVARTKGGVWRAERRCQEYEVSYGVLARDNDESTLFLICNGIVSHLMTSSRDSAESRCQGHGFSYGSACDGNRRVGVRWRTLRHDVQPDDAFPRSAWLPKTQCQP